MFSSCSLDSRPILPPDAGAATAINGTMVSAQTSAANTAAGTSAAAASSAPNPPSAQTGLGGISMPTQPAVTIPPPIDVDAGPAQPAQPANQAPTKPQGPAQTPTTTAPANKSCNRDTLQKRAAAYLQALSTGDLKPLNLHPQARYTENGQTQMLGLGLWLSRPKTEFSRHVLDELRCSASTVAVVNDGRSRTILGLRLRYVEEQLLEIEAQVVFRNINYYNPEAVIPAGADPWIVPVPNDQRMTREALVTLAEHYFDASFDDSLLPPHAPGCKRTQNGVLLGRDGDCGMPAGNERFEQRRFPVIDEVTGIVVSIVYFRNFVGMCLFKAQNDTLQMMEVIGGASAPSTGW